VLGRIGFSEDASTAHVMSGFVVAGIANPFVKLESVPVIIQR
jgi:hypothetical protein